MARLAVALIPALPLLAALSNGGNALLGERYSPRVAGRLASGSILLSFLGSIWVLAGVLSGSLPRDVTIYRWIASGDLTVDFAFFIDALTVTMMLVTTGIGFVVSVFSINYMTRERGHARYFTVVPLFIFAMLVLVMSDNYVLLFLGWEGVGVCSYLLISFYYERKNALEAGTRAFIMNRIGDAGFLLGIFLIITTFGTAEYSAVFARAGDAGTGTLTAIGLLLLVGAVGKSAQLPLGTWLARAMEGPTPSSALIHAATMVTAGVYMVVRTHPIYDRAPDALLTVAIVGGATALFGGMVGLVQTDIKGLLAYSTTAQLGLMFLAAGLGAYAVAIFHLATHAIFKTLLFLTAPSILEHLHTRADPLATGNAAERAPLPHRLFLAGAAGLAVVPFLSGWWQLELFGRSLAGRLPLLGAFVIVAVFAAALAAARMTRVAFEEGHGDVGTRLTTKLVKPVVVVLVLATIGWLAGVFPGGVRGTWFRDFLAPVVAPRAGVPTGSPALAVALMTTLILILASGWFAAIFLDRFRPERPGLRLFRLRGLYYLAQNRLWLDELYDTRVIRAVRRLAAWLERFDSEVIDRLAGAPRPAKAPPSVEMWEERLLTGRPDAVAPGGIVLGPLAPAPRARVRQPAFVGDTPGIFGSLTRAGSDATGWIEQQFLGRLTGGLARTMIETLAKFSGWFERVFIGRTGGLINRFGAAAATLTAVVERLIFDTGIHVGMPAMGGAAGRMLNRLEAKLGNPVVVATILVASLIALLVGTVWS